MAHAEISAIDMDKYCTIQCNSVYNLNRPRAHRFKLPRTVDRNIISRLLFRPKDSVGVLTNLRYYYFGVFINKA